MEINTLSKAIQSLSTQSQGLTAAIDVGFGYTKMAWAFRNREGFKTDIFPSLAPSATGGGMDDSEQLMARRDTHIVPVLGRRYEVGKDAELAQIVSGSRCLDDSYIETPEHLALLKGALCYIGASHLDLLVVGLPVNHMKQPAKIEKLKALCAGPHDLGNGAQVTVGQVLVLPQPLGGLYEQAFRTNSYESVRARRNLVLDPGQFTFDYLMTQGLKPIHHMCDSHTYAVDRVVKALKQSISRTTGRHFNGTTRIEQAIQSGTIKIERKDYPLTDFMDEQVKSTLKESVQLVASSLDEIDRIESITLVGGAGKLYADAVRQQFRMNEVATCENGIYANVIGYLLAGMLRMQAVAA